MIHADLHGKLGDASDLEDVLTSSIFGSLEMLSPTNRLSVIKEIFSYARGIKGNATAIEKIHDKYDLCTDFWSKISSGEPDLIYKFGDSSDDNKISILVEVKFRSGKSGSSAIDESGETVAQDQLAKYWNCQKEWAGNGTPHLIYLTADRVLPLEEINQSLEGTIGESSLQFYWLSWFSVRDAMVETIKNKPINPDVTCMLKLLVKYLEKKDLGLLMGGVQILETNA